MKQNYDKKFGDIWLRARHNALANLEAAESASKRAMFFEVIISFLIIMPLASTILAKVCLFFSKYDVLFSVIGGLGALYFSLVGFVRDARKKDDYHRRAHSIFNNIAQKARRGDNPDLDGNEKMYLIRSLEEMFETAKNNSYEPSDKNYNKGWERLRNMPKLPFGIELTQEKGISLNQKSEESFSLYESLKTEDVHSSWIHTLDFKDKKVLDIGAGSGRDAAYFATRSASLIVAVDKSRDMLRLAKQKHGDKNIVWLEESLPSLKALNSTELGSFDFILCSAVFMFLSQDDQVNSLKTILSLLKEKGVAIITIKTNVNDNTIQPLTSDFYSELEKFGCTVEELSGDDDLLGRGEITWTVYKIMK